MKRRQKVNYVGIGIFIFIGLALIVVGIFFAGRYSYIFNGGYRLKVEYTFLDDLLVGAKVRVGGGMTIGHVQEINFKDRNLEVVLIIDDGRKINRTASFHIFSTSLVGVKYIDVQNYDPNYTDYYQKDETIIGVSPIGMSRIMEMLGSMAGGLISDESGASAGLGKAFAEIGELISSLNRIVKNSESDIEKSVNELSTTIAGTGSMVKKLDNTLGQLEKMVTGLNKSVSVIDEKKVAAIVQNIEQTTVELKAMSQDLNSLSQNRNSVLYLIRDKNFKDRVDKISKNLEEFSEILKDKPNAIIMGK